MITVREVVDRAGLEEAWRIRLEVFVGEQRVPLEEEVDARDEDPSTLHAVAYVGGVPAGTGRVLRDTPGHVHVGRVAVRAPFRSSGVGTALMVHLEGRALTEYGLVEGDGRISVVVALSAQESAMGFYSRIGYSVVSTERYLDAGIWHQDMARTITL
nr:GNAT family N-acetyltransferase [Actinomycetales bacterium]